MSYSTQSTYPQEFKQENNPQGFKSSEPVQDQQPHGSQFSDPTENEATFKHDHGSLQAQNISQSEGQLPKNASVLPSQLLGSYQVALPPPSMYAEDPCYTTQPPLSFNAPLYPYMTDNPPDLNFAKTANDMINIALGRTPGGNSVVEPDSVLGESGRLYHGYKQGKYFLPNDAVCSVALSES